jgi:hypothetical protein
MQIHSVGIDLGKTTFHLVALGTASKVLARNKFTQKQLLAYTANMQTSLIGLEAGSERPLPRPGAAQAGTRCPVDSGPVCEALREVEQERLHRRGGDRGGGGTQEHALCSDQDGRSAGFAGDPSGPRSAHPYALASTRQP